MDAEKHIKKNYIFNLLYEVVVVIYPLIITPYLSRVLLPSGIGIKSYTYAIMTYFYYFGMLGIDIYGQKEIARYKDDMEKKSQLFFELLILKGITMFIAILGFVFAVLFTPLGTEYKIYFLCWLPFLFDAMIGVKWYLTGINYFKQLSLINIVIKVASIFAIYFFIKQESDLFLYILILGFVPLLSDFISYYFVFKTVKKVKINFSNFKYLLKETFVYFIPAIATALYSTIDKAMITNLVGEEENGFYEQAHKMITLCTTIATALFTVLRTACSSLANDELRRKEYRLLLNEYLKMTALIVFPLSFGLLAISRDFVPLFFGDKYLASTSILMILCPLIIIISITQFINSAIIIPKNLTLKMNGLYFLCAGINIILNLFLIPARGAVGAAIASVISETFLMFCFMGMSRRELGIKTVIFSCIRYFIFSAFMAGIVILFSYFVHLQDVFKVMIEILIGMISYLILLIVTKDSCFTQLWSEFKKILIRKRR